MFPRRIRQGSYSAGEEGVVSTSVEIEIDGGQIHYSISAPQLSCSAPLMVYSSILETVPSSVSSEFTPPQPYSHRNNHKLRNKSRSNALCPSLISPVLAIKNNRKPLLTLKQSSTSNEIVSYDIQNKYAKKSTCYPLIVNRFSHRSTGNNSKIEEKRNDPKLEYNMNEDVLVCLSDAGLDSEDWQSHENITEFNHIHINVLLCFLFHDRLQSIDSSKDIMAENISVVTSESDHTPVVSDINDCTSVYHSPLSQWCWKSDANNWVLYGDTLAMKIHRLNVGQTYDFLTPICEYAITRLGKYTAVQYNVAKKRSRRVKHICRLFTTDVLLSCKRRIDITHEYPLLAYSPQSKDIQYSPIASHVHKNRSRHRSKNRRNIILHAPKNMKNIECGIDNNRNINIQNTWYWKNANDCWLPYDQQISETMNLISVGQSFFVNIHGAQYKISRMTEKSGIQQNMRDMTICQIRMDEYCEQGIRRYKRKQQSMKKSQWENIKRKPLLSSQSSTPNIASNKFLICNPSSYVTKSRYRSISQHSRLPEIQPHSDSNSPQILPKLNPESPQSLVVGRRQTVGNPIYVSSDQSLSSSSSSPASIVILNMNMNLSLNMNKNEINSCKIHSEIFDYFYSDLKYEKYKITSITNVSNKHFLSVYKSILKIKKQNLTKSNKIELSLWYGASFDTIKKVIGSGFDRSCDVCSVFGKGKYFTRYSHKCKKYSIKDEKGYQYFLLCRVIVGSAENRCRGNPKMMSMPMMKYNNSGSEIEYDCMVDDMTYPSIYIISRDYHAFPEYMVQFKKRNRKKIGKYDQKYQQRTQSDSLHRHKQHHY